MKNKKTKQGIQRIILFRVEFIMNVYIKPSSSNINVSPELYLI